MRRILLTLGPSTGGIGRHVRDLAEYLACTGVEPHAATPWEVTVAGPADLATGWMSGLASGDGKASFVPVDMPGPWRRARSAYRHVLPHLGRCDLVHAHGIRAGLVTALAARRHHIPSVVTVHNKANIYGARRTLGLPPVSERSLSIVADEVVAASPDLARALGPKAHMIVVPAALDPSARDPETVRDELGVPPGDVLVLAVARLHPQKRLQDLLRAATELPGDVHVVIAGDGPARDDLERSPAVSMGRATLLGHREDVPDLVAACDIAVLCSAWEAIPLFLKEAAAAGKPLVGTDSGGIPSIVVPEESGILVPVGDPMALRDALAVLAADPRLRRTLGCGAQARVETEFSPAVAFGRLEALYREVLR